MINEPHIAFHQLLNSLESYPTLTALFDKEDNAYSYQELKGMIKSSVTQLEKKGIQKGDFVLIAVPMSVELYAILEAVFAKGATAIFLDPWMKGKKMDQIIRLVQPKLFIVTRKLSRVTWLLPSTWSIKKWRLKTIDAIAGDFPIADIQDADDALITFTSGTSGTSKGANRSYAFIHEQENTLSHHLSAAEPSVDFTNFPMVGLVNFALGNTVVIPKMNFMKIHKANEAIIVKQIEDRGVTRLIVSPALLRKILNHLPAETGVKEVITGGAPVTVPLVKKAVQGFPAIAFQAIYGSTEAEPIAIARFKDIIEQNEDPLKGVYVGKPVSDIRIKIIQPTDGIVKTDQVQQLELKQDEIGEILVTGDHVNKSYYNNEKAFLENKVKDATGEIWHRTGDIGYLTSDGLFLVGRQHRIMQYEGKSIHPYPIEQLVESQFNLPDNGYVQDEKGEFILYYHSLHTTDPEAIKAAFEAANYPLDVLIRMHIPLPRDARHGSKLQVDQLKIPRKKQALIRFSS